MHNFDCIEISWAPNCDIVIEYARNVSSEEPLLWFKTLIVGLFCAVQPTLLSDVVGSGSILPRENVWHVLLNSFSNFFLI